MVTFTIPGDTKKYKYPNKLEDITFQQFLKYTENILPHEPGALQDLRTAGTRTQELWARAYRVVASYGFEPKLFEERVEAKKKVNPDYIPTFDEFVHWAKTHQLKPSKKLNDEMDELLKGWDEVTSKKQEASAFVADLKKLARQILPYMAKVVSYFTGVPYEVLLGKTGQPMHHHDLEGIYWTIQRALEWHPKDYKYKEVFQFNGEEYVLPGRLMENGTTIELMEASQFQESMGNLKEGKYYALRDVVAVLLKKRGEVYSDEVFQRNQRDFLRLPMSTVMDIVFFLNRQSNRSATDFQIYTTAQALARLKRELGRSASHTAGTLA